MKTKEISAVDVNHASLNDLTQVPGLGPSLAARVIDGRPYEKIEDLARVRGISPVTLEPMRPYLTVVPVAALETPRVKKSSVHSLTGEKMARPSIPESKLPAAKLVTSSETTPAPKVEKLMTQNPSPEEAVVPAPPILETSASQAVIPPPAVEAPVPQAVPPAASEPAIPQAPAQTSASPISSVVETGGSQVVAVPQAQIIPSQEPPQVNKLMLTINPPTQSAPPPPQPQPQQTQAQPAPAPRTISRGEALAWGFGGSLVTMILTVLVTLGILLAINGTLSLTPAASFNNLQRSLDTLSVQMDTMRQDVTAVKSKMDSLDAMGTRLGAAEKDVVALRTEMDSSLKDFDRVQAQIEQTTEEITTLKTRSENFERFLDGLRVLVGSSVQPQQNNTTP